MASVARPDTTERPIEAGDRARIDEQLRLVDVARAVVGRDSVPYVAHVRLRDGGNTTDVLLAGRGFGDEGMPPGVRIIDWQRSPLADVFFAHKEGEKYEHGTLRGEIVEKNLAVFDGGELSEIATPDRVLVRRGSEWVRTDPAPHRLSPRPRDVRPRPPSLIDVTLDPAQRHAVELPFGQSVLLLGEAGHGKTTVALHRLLHLERTASKPWRAVVIVPTDGLRRLVEPLMTRLGIDVEVRTYDEWAASQARRAFPDIPRRESRDATPGVIRVKRDPALMPLLATMARRRPGRIDDDKDAPVVRTKAWARRADLQHLFGDRALMKKLAAAAKSGVTASMVADVLEHTHVQFSKTSEQEYAHVVDPERLLAVDGRAMDDGTPTEDAQTIDTEDYAVLFELDRLRAERRGGPPTRPRPYDCIVLDEAQELAPLELTLIGRSLAPGGTLVVAGDADQQLDPAASFSSWDETMRGLGHVDHERIVLEVGYRCPPDVVSLARAIREPGGTGRAEVAAFTSECHLGVWLIGELSDLCRRDKNASVAVICRTQVGARRMAHVLVHALPSRLVYDGRFLFRAGINVTSVEQVKGLEFDYVVVPDASSAAYPDLGEPRRALYVAVTRARCQVLLACVGERTKMIASE
jgi:DNA helicase IV